MLSGQVQQIMRLRQVGANNKEIGKALGMSPAEVERQIRKSVMRPSAYTPLSQYWTEARDKKIETMVRQGLSAEQMVAAFPGKTPGAIQHRIVKLGLRPFSTVWTEDRDEKLVELWAEGKSYLQIADILNRQTNPDKPITRGSVSGRVMRLGLPKKTPAGFQAKGRKPRKMQQKARGVSGHFKPVGDIIAPLPEIDDSAIPAEQRKTFQELENHHCKWPIGDPKDADFSFCGGKRQPASSYCQHHSERASQGAHTRIRYADRKALKHLQAAE